MRKNNALIVFLKAPEFGRVKTRLQEKIGVFSALKLYKAMVEDLLDNLKHLSDFDLRLFYTPSDKRHLFTDWLSDHSHLTPQIEGNLGEKMLAAFQAVFGEGYRKAIIIGSDLPDISKAAIERAFLCLSEADIVLGPSSDGGYYLIGLKEAVPELFSDIRWSSEQVFPETMRRIRKLGLQVDLLEEKRDIDTFEDLNFYFEKMKNLRDRQMYQKMPRTITLIENIIVKQNSGKILS